MSGVLEPHQVRVVEEKAELDKKIDALNSFISDSNETFTKLETAERVRLVEQRTYMMAYSRLLGERIAAFKVQS